MVRSDNKKWFALALILAVQFMTILDIAIVNVALPSIQLDLGFSQENLQWVISAYALVFGGFLLLGGRSATCSAAGACSWPERSIFTLGSLLCGLAWSEASLIAFRALQGLGAATLTPAALVDPRRDVRRRPRAQHRAGRVGRRRRLRRRSGRPLRRHPHRPALLGVDLLRQRPGRRRRADPHAAPAVGEPRPARPGLRRSGRRARHVGSLAPRARASRRATGGVGARQDRGRLRRLRGAAPRVHRLGAARRRIRSSRSRSSGSRR